MANTCTATNTCTGAITIINNQPVIDYTRISAIIILLIISQYLLNKGLTKHRKKVMTASLITLGLILPTCTCDFVITQTIIKAIIGNPLTPLLSLLVIGGIIITFTLIYGRTYCGWVCPLGAAQELINRKEKLSNQAKAMMRVISYSLIIILIYLTIKGVSVNGPTININKLTSQSVLLLTLITLTASVITYRPWCKLCPFGLILGLTSKLSIKKIKLTSKCNECNACKTNCQSNAINKGRIDRVECINCGECVNNCPLKSLKMK